MWNGVSNQVKELHEACSEGCHLHTFQICSQTMQWLLPASSQSVQKSWFSIVLNATPAAERAPSSDTWYCTHLAWAVITHAPLLAKTIISCYVKTNLVAWEGKALQHLPVGFSKCKSLFNHCISVRFQEKQLSSEWLTLLSPNHLSPVLSMASTHSGSQGPGMKCVSGLLRSTIMYCCVFNSGSFHERPFLHTLRRACSLQDNFLFPSTVVVFIDTENVFTMVQNSSNCGKILEYKHLNNNNGGYFPEACWLQWFCYKVTLWVILTELCDPLLEANSMHSTHLNTIFFFYTGKACLHTYKLRDSRGVCVQPNTIRQHQSFII